MKTFKAFLQELAPHIRAEEAAREKMKDGWISSVDALISQMRPWLEGSDPGGLLRLETRSIGRTEESIGPYLIDTLEIRMGNRLVSVEPMACDIRGPVSKPREGSWRGRVDLIGGPYTSKV